MKDRLKLLREEAITYSILITNYIAFQLGARFRAKGVKLHDHRIYRVPNEW